MFRNAPGCSACFIDEPINTTFYHYHQQFRSNSQIYNDKSMNKALL